MSGDKRRRTCQSRLGEEGVIVSHGTETTETHPTPASGDQFAIATPKERVILSATALGYVSQHFQEIFVAKGQHVVPSVERCIAASLYEQLAVLESTTAKHSQFAAN